MKRKILKRRNIDKHLRNVNLPTALVRHHEKRCEKSAIYNYTLTHHSSTFYERSEQTPMLWFALERFSPIIVVCLRLGVYSSQTTPQHIEKFVRSIISMLTPSNNTIWTPSHVGLCRATMISVQVYCASESGILMRTGIMKVYLHIPSTTNTGSRVAWSDVSSLPTLANSGQVSRYANSLLGHVLD